MKELNVFQLNKLQYQLWDWQQKNFPTPCKDFDAQMTLNITNALHIASYAGHIASRVFKENHLNNLSVLLILGIVEESGELCHHLLKKSQNIRNNEDHDSKIKDSIADIIIFTMNLCSNNNWKISEIAQEPIYNNDKDNHQTLKQEINILFRRVRCFCTTNFWNLSEILTTTADEVMKRDWIQYPDTGLPPIPQTDNQTLLNKYKLVADTGSGPDKAVVQISFNDDNGEPVIIHGNSLEDATSKLLEYHSANPQAE